MEKYTDSIYEKTKIQNLKDKILQNFSDNLWEVFDSGFKTFKSNCEGLVEHAFIKYDKQIEHLQGELKSED